MKLRRILIEPSAGGTGRADAGAGTGGVRWMVLRPAAAAVICSAFVLIHAPGRRPGRRCPSNRSPSALLTAGDRALEPASPLAIDAPDPQACKALRLAVEDDADDRALHGQRFALLGREGGRPGRRCAGRPSPRKPPARASVGRPRGRASHRGLGCHLARRDHLAQRPRARRSLAGSRRKPVRPCCMLSPAGPWRRTRWRNISS